MIESMTATAPGKLIVTGEYAVLDGAPALVVAMDRRVVARYAPGVAHGSSPFLLALAHEIAVRHGDAAAQRALSIVVDSSSFFEGDQKLGLGSSAAVTVAATALALAAGHGPQTIDRDAVLSIACAAHAGAQGAMGARGSGADVASAVYGGAIVFTMARSGSSHSDAPGVLKRRWPHSVRIVPFFTGASASTADLVSRVSAARTAHPVAVDAALAAITQASNAACKAIAAPADLAQTALIAAISLAGAAIDRLAIATGVDLVPPCVIAARAAMARFGGTAKTTGAGGGDIGIAVIPGTADVTDVRRSLIQAGCQVLHLSVDETGVDLQANAQ
jgi:phosphomevalonate kinase